MPFLFYDIVFTMPVCYESDFPRGKQGGLTPMKMLRIENKGRKNTAEEPKPSAKEAGNGGIADTFEPQEIKHLFFNYLTTMLVIEGGVFFFCFVSHLASPGSVFPWKPYLFATFITPIAITFIFGIILLTFNRFFFRESIDNGFDPRVLGTWEKGQRTVSFLQLIYRLPFLGGMVLLIAGSVLIYKLDDIAFYALQIGSGVAKYLFFTFIGILLLLAGGLIIWMILSFRLRQETLKSDHQYRMQLMEQFGMVMLEDGTMLNKEGKILNQSHDTGILAASEKAKLLTDDEADIQILEDSRNNGQSNVRPGSDS